MKNKAQCHVLWCVFFVQCSGDHNRGQPCSSLYRHTSEINHQNTKLNLRSVVPVAEYWLAYCSSQTSSLYCLLPFPTDRVDICEETEETIDQVAVLTSNALFFVVMFIFAVFETYVIHSTLLRNPVRYIQDTKIIYNIIIDYNNNSNPS